MAQPIPLALLVLNAIGAAHGDCVGLGPAGGCRTCSTTAAHTVGRSDAGNDQQCGDATGPLACLTQPTVRGIMRTGLSLLEKGSKGRRREESDNAPLTWRFSPVAFPNLTWQNCRGNATFVVTFSCILLIIK
jgi:hypothetical protein